MKAEGIVKEKSADMVIVSVIREGACGGNCSACGGCGGTVIKTAAKNRVNAEVGDRVLLESDSKTVLMTAFLLYILPVVIFFAVFAVLYSLSASTPIFVVSEAAVMIAYIILSKLTGFGTKITVSAVEIISRNNGL